MWKPKSSQGVASLAMTLRMLQLHEPLPVRAAPRVIAAERLRRGAPVRLRAVRYHLAYALSEGLIEAVTVDGKVCYKLTEKGCSFLASLLGE